MRVDPVIARLIELTKADKVPWDITLVGGRISGEVNLNGITYRYDSFGDEFKINETLQRKIKGLWELRNALRNYQMQQHFKSKAEADTKAVKAYLQAMASLWEK